MNYLKIQQIKTFRRLTGAGLRVSKEMIELTREISEERGYNGDDASNMLNVGLAVLLWTKMKSRTFASDDSILAALRTAYFPKAESAMELAAREALAEIDSETTNLRKLS